MRHALQGSSPHTRGAPLRLLEHRRLRGIIPAYAGSTEKYRSRSVYYRDHPRIRGEHCWTSVHIVESAGSSPHTRGAPSFVVKRQDLVGIIPAYAGSTKSVLAGSSCSRDHPRIRGEHLAPVCPRRRAAGSSPHTRGALDWLQIASVSGGIIPAYAGSTLVGCARCTLKRDHPRIRGEHIISSFRTS